MTYNDALDFIHGTLKFGSVLGLNSIRHLLGLMDNPHEKLKIIHVAGTNGKGSTCAFITEILKKQGYKVGMYISPYVEDFCERIQINREYINRNDVAEYTQKMKTFIEKMTEDNLRHPTEFEIITALAFLYFYEKQCDFVVLETGLGGEFDATNAIPCPLVSVITDISMDHMQYLGDTIEKIAKTKCGIIKKDGIAVCYPMQNKVPEVVIRDTCTKQGAVFIKPDSADIKIRKMVIDGTIFDYKEYKNLQIKLLGEHQVYNAVTAITAIEAIREHNDFDISIDSIYGGLFDTVFQGRFEIIKKQPLVVIDGAHNYSGVLAFKNAVLKYLNGKRKIVVAGMLEDKEHKKCVEELAGLADIFIAVSPDNSRALSAKTLADEAGAYCSDIYTARNMDEAMERAYKYYNDNSVICVCGSLFLIGGLR